VVKTLFWDFNGTILDDARLCHDILVRMLHEVGRPTVTFEEYLDIFTFPVRDYYAKVYDLEAVSFDVLAKRFIDLYKPESLKVPLTEGAVGTIKAVKAMGYRNVLLSASEINNLKEQLNHFGIGYLFDDVLGTSDIHAGTKTDIALDHVRNHPFDKKRSLMVGDTLHDAEVADAIGCDIVLYTGGHQSKKRLAAHHTIDRITDVLGILSEKGD
jgi:phosphoglycolate phosphatase